MALYRTLAPVVYVDNGKAVSVNADRVIEVTEEQALALAGSLAAVIDEREGSMFPDGTPVINHTIVRDIPVVAFAPEPAHEAPVEEPEPAKAAPKASAK